MVQPMEDDMIATEHIVKAAKIIWYDNGIINKDVSEESKVDLLMRWTRKLDQKYVVSINTFLGSLSEDALNALCCRNIDEANKIGFDVENNFLDRIFMGSYEREIKKEIDSRNNFEKYWDEKYPNKICRSLPNGNYSGWNKQELWELWQYQEKRIDEAYASCICYG